MRSFVVVVLFTVMVGVSAGVLVAALACAAGNADDALDVWDLDDEDLP